MTDCPGYGVPPMDAELVEHHVNGPGPLRTQLAAAIREGG